MPTATAKKTLAPVTLVKGDLVTFHTGNAWRRAKVLTTPRPGSKSVSVGSFRYANGRLSKPRRVYVCLIAKVPGV